jgi:hypothetical protein
VCCVELLTALSPPADSDKAWLRKIITFTFTQLRRIQSLRPRSLPDALEYLLRPSRHSNTVAINFSDQSHRLALILLGSNFSIFSLAHPAQHSCPRLHCSASHAVHLNPRFLSQAASTRAYIHHKPTSQSTLNAPVERLLQLA